jgi:hypothetical protein
MAYDDKDEERKRLLHFLAARKSATNEELVLVEDSESPDFICRKPDGTLVGVEHTRILYDPEAMEIRQVCGDDDADVDNFAVVWDASVAVAKKEAIRRKPHWRLPASTILVLDLVDRGRFESWPTDDAMSDEFEGSGFVEVWISDHSSLAAFSRVTAIGLYPRSIWGIRGQGYLSGVPFK